GSYIATNAVISQTSIGKYCSIGPNFICGWGIHPTNGLSTSPMFYSTKKQNGFSLSKTDKIEERKQIKIGNDVFIGMNVTILDGVTIGDGAVIGAGAVVSKDIPPYAIAVGSPIQIKKYRFNQDTINALLEIKWWNFEEEDKLKDIEKYFFDIDAFILKYINKNQ
ncbi:CatB-related O-acetyltransferase, partial [Pseudoxanthomonas sp. SGD-10]